MFLNGVTFLLLCFSISILKDFSDVSFLLSDYDVTFLFSEEFSSFSKSILTVFGSSISIYYS